MARPSPLRRLVAAATLAAAVVGCSTAGGPSPGTSDASDAASAGTSGPASAVPDSPSPASASASARASGVPSGSPATSSLRDAVSRLLESDSATFELVITRFKPDLPAEVTAVGSGVVDPAGDRGRMRFELFPNDPEGAPFSLGPIDIAWDPTDYWTSAGPDDSDGAWQHTTRASAPGMALIGRVNEEPLALLRLAAAADDAELAAPSEFAGEPAERWLLSVPADAAGEAFVPPDTYLAFSQVFSRPDLPLEVWLVGREVVRVGYVLEREKAPYGGPDRIETWYDWSAIGEPIELTLPPTGEIVEID